MSIDIAWMAWTWATGIFFILLAITLTVMTVLALRYPETERIGILRIPTTRGDRLFISLLTAAFIHLLFLGFFGAEPMFTLPFGEDGLAVSRLWLASVIALLNATAIFKWV
jgi:predicted small integral membrane protein